MSCRQRHILSRGIGLIRRALHGLFRTHKKNWGASIPFVKPSPVTITTQFLFICSNLSAAHTKKHPAGLGPCFEWDEQGVDCSTDDYYTNTCKGWQQSQLAWHSHYCFLAVAHNDSGWAANWVIFCRKCEGVTGGPQSEAESNHYTSPCVGKMSSLLVNIWCLSLPSHHFNLCYYQLTLPYDALLF